MTAQLSREELQQIADTDHVQCGDAAAMARMLLAGMDSEPVAWWTGPEPTPTGEIESIHDHETGSHTIPLCPRYSAAPPAPVAVPDCFRNAVSALESLYRNGQKQCWHERYTTDMAYASGVLNACRAAMQAEPVTAATGWIKCGERMPAYGTYLVRHKTLAGDKTDVATFMKYDSKPPHKNMIEAWISSAPGIRKVTHWMPLPAAPEQEV